jgi:hypothetical protein
MSRRLLLPLLSALALLLVAAPASLAAATTAAPAAHAAADDDLCGDGESAVESDDGTIDCSGDDVADDGSDDADALCDDDGSADDGEDDTAAEIATADDCDEALAAPLLTQLSAKLSGRGRGAKLSVAFTLDSPGEVALTLRRSESGTTSGKRCVAAAKHGTRAAKGKGGKKGKRCTRTVTLPGTVHVDGDAGANSFTVTKWKARLLKPGAYTLTATPTDDGGEAVTTSFAVAAR